MRTADSLVVTTRRAGRSPSIVDSGLRFAMRLLWLVVLPLLFSGLALRLTVPRSLTASGFEGACARVAREHTLVLAVLLFLVLTGLLNYWRNWLPGGRYLSTLPESLVERVPPRRVQACEEAVSLLAAVDGPLVKQFILASSPERGRELAACQAKLEWALAKGKWSQVGDARSALQQLVQPLIRRQERRRSWGFVLLLAVSVTLALLVRARLFQVFDVWGTSMLPSLAPGDLIAGRPRAYSSRKLPARAEVVVLQVAVDGRDQDVVKRVIGLPGDRIGMQGAHPVINGWAVPLCDVGAYYSASDETAKSGDPGGRLVMEFLEDRAYLVFQAVPADPFEEYSVKPGEIFTLGDNRSNSRDSRNFAAGAARGFPLSDVRARAEHLIFSRTSRGDIDPKSVWQPLGLALNLDGLELGEVRAGVERCLAAKPRQSSPPAPEASYPVSRTP